MVGIQIHKTKGAAGPAAHSLQHLVVFLAELLRGRVGLKREPQGEHNPVDSQTVRELDQLRHALFRGFSWRRTEMAVHIPDQGWRVRFRGAGKPGLGLSQRQGQGSAKASEKCSPVEHKGLEFSLQAAPSLVRLFAGPVSPHSPEELGGELKDPRLSRRTYNPEPAAREISVWSAELSVVEGVEGLDPDLQIDAFADLRVLMQPKVPVVESWPVEETTVGGAERPEGLHAESIAVKPAMVSLPQVVRDLERAD